MTPSQLRLHASCVCLGERGILIRGASGSGKSSLALRLIDGGATLVSDDQTVVAIQDGRVVASAPEAIRGKLEVRGMGIVDVADAGPTPVALIVDLAPACEIARLPEESELVETVLGHPIARIRLDPRGADATARIRLALGYFNSGATLRQAPSSHPSNNDRQAPAPARGGGQTNP